ncbi:MAG TPA: hypothetical protein VJ976_02740 [Ornithinimicrobium sp.]|uniref:hypothetical protein n=1 Tax=Ornithinimicrobium sp. TaxID=1977084 RepID=UPI002B48AD88|nr:hypothetical protein [Ornithinimicrobium sp.]HKJ11288.1 hypothetical protein [Ornithinimicrobium sp.]
MRARSAVFDLFGDHLLPRGSGSPVAAIVALTAACAAALPPAAGAYRDVVLRDIAGFPRTIKQSEASP